MNVEDRIRQQIAAARRRREARRQQRAEFAENRGYRLATRHRRKLRSLAADRASAADTPQQVFRGSPEIPGEPTVEVDRAGQPVFPGSRENLAEEDE
ncbi:hypothetical protein [Streptomyces coffeae]|uniref:Uncharacterized protein n=1 Tax=Streptomyces coffeae TaxID=621382 RepID=A0ABS1NG07_9ACTN|nr:hypothetical protein [Streptomyces coffeae]MBL1098919.1 hypothetical protein [Streptomyces coffeae]